LKKVNPNGEARINTACLNTGNKATNWNVEMKAASNDEWTFIAIAHRNKTSAGSPQHTVVYTNLGVNEEYLTAPTCLYDPASFFNAIEVNYPVLISPITMVRVQDAAPWNMKLISLCAFLLLVTAHFLLIQSCCLTGARDAAICPDSGGVSLERARNERSIRPHGRKQSSRTDPGTSRQERFWSPVYAHGCTDHFPNPSATNSRLSVQL